MIRDQFILDLQHEIIVDLFAGGGGASTGIEHALGRHVDIAINHDPEAINLHTANHPQTRHYISDVFEVDPLEATQGRPVGLLWASPSCTHFSRARGGVPVNKQLRSLGWVVVRWASKVRPRVIMCENVAEWQDWGPVVNGQPCPQRKGRTFRQWVGRLRNLGYQVEWRELRACDYGAPTIRKRLFIVARCDGEPIIWPEPTHGPGRQPYRTAAECIDWSLPCPSIFERKRPLADATCRRIAKGIVRHIIEVAEPFIVPLPLSTIVTENRHALIASTLVQVGYGERQGQSPRVPGLDKPLGTVVCASKHALVAAFLAKHYTGVVGSDLREPIGTITSVDHHSLVTARLSQAQPGQGRAEQVQAFLMSYYGTDQAPELRRPMPTVTTKDRFAIVQVRGQPYRIADIGMRMLTPRELFNAQGFPPEYCIDTGADGRPLTKTAQLRMCGNSVVPQIAAAIVRANCQHLLAYSRAELRQLKPHHPGPQQRAFFMEQA